MKTEVYSWRVSTELKSTLEREARRRNISLSAVLDSAVQQWIENARSGGDDEEQHRVRAAALACAGSITGGDPHRAENARRTLRQRLQQNRA